MPEASRVEFLERYQQEAARWLQVGSIAHRSAAIRCSDRPLDSLDGVAMVSALRAALDGPWWREPASPHGRNWVWRDDVPAFAPAAKGRQEVALERAVAQRSRQSRTCQMSTSSGLRPGRSEGRRSIDLVQRVDDGVFRSIELKVRADHPLFAAFEILGYGLCFLLARQQGRRGAGRHDVIHVRRIELIVLGPDGWYHHMRRSRSNPVARYEFDGLAERINVGLASEVRALGISGLDAMTIGFLAYRSSGNVDTDVAAVERGDRGMTCGSSSPRNQLSWSRSCRI